MLAVVLAGAVAVVSGGGPPQGQALARAQTAPSHRPVTNVTEPPVDLQSFIDAGRGPAAAGPIERLPAVDLSTVFARQIPPAALAAYSAAARRTARATPRCHLRWWLLAGIGFVESRHGASGRPHGRRWDGVARPPIFGPLLDGRAGYPRVHDRDDGAYDRNTRWDRAVGPMQFLPLSWKTWSARGRHAGHADPQDIRPAATAAGRYLCAGGRNLTAPGAAAVAVYGYNHSIDYVRLVLSVAARYAGRSPHSLGVDDLPSESEVRRASASASPQGRPSPTASPTPAPSRSPSPSSGPSRRPGGSPSPSGSSPPPPIVPLPTLTGRAAGPD